MEVTNIIYCQPPKYSLVLVGLKKRTRAWYWRQLTPSYITHTGVFSWPFKLLLLGVPYSSEYLRAEYVAMSQKWFTSPLLHRNIIIRSCIAYDWSPILLQLTQQLHPVIWQGKGAMLYHVWSRDGRAIDNISRPDVLSYAAYTIHVADRHARYDIASLHEAICRRFYPWTTNISRTAVLTIVVCFWSTFRAVMVLYCAKGRWTVKDRFMSREARCITAKNRHCIYPNNVLRSTIFGNKRSPRRRGGRAPVKQLVYEENTGGWK